jgi:hypothetical protein
MGPDRGRSLRHHDDQRAERHIAENRTQAYHQKVLRMIQGAGERGLTKSELTRRTQFLELRQREEILLALTESGQIELGQRLSDTKPATVFRAGMSSQILQKSKILQLKDLEGPRC